MIVYWLHRATHNNKLKEGYIGITKDSERRRKEYFTNVKKHNIHLQRALNKYNDIEFDIIFEGSKRECLDLEHSLRPKKNIGWNIASGGSIPPSPKGKKRSVDTRRKMSENNVGFSGRKHSEETKMKMSKSHKGQKAHNAMRVHTPHGIFDSMKRAGQFSGVDPTTIANRVRSTSAKFTDYYFI